MTASSQDSEVVKCLLCLPPLVTTSKLQLNRMTITGSHRESGQTENNLGHIEETTSRLVEGTEV